MGSSPSPSPTHEDDVSKDDEPVPATASRSSSDPAVKPLRVSGRLHNGWNP